MALTAMLLNNAYKKGKAKTDKPPINPIKIPIVLIREAGNFMRMARYLPIYPETNAIKAPISAHICIAKMAIPAPSEKASVDRP
jgi:hypothetical protein